jgi:hypothetical protein
MPKIRTGGAAAVVLAAVSCAHAQDAVQWRAEDGGNGHWYTTLRFTHSLNWPDARHEAFQLGADLVSLETLEEQAWASDAELQPAESVWIGLYQPAGTCEPSCGWQWTSGEPLSAAAWALGEPNNQGGGWGDEDHALMLGNGWGCMPICYGQWADWPGATGLGAEAAIVEWSADCNGDGIVDYGQILDGTHHDENGNGVPDCCDGTEPCPGDLNGDDTVGPPDLGILLDVWGTDGGKISAADINEDGTVNAADLGLLVGAWGDCGCN